MGIENSYGSIEMSPDGQRGVLYSTASGLTRFGIWERGSQDVTTIGLQKPVLSAGISPNGDAAVLFHGLDDANVNPESPFYGEYALTLVELETAFTNPIRLDGEPLAYANAADGETGYFIMADQPYVGVLDYANASHALHLLPSAPQSLGVLSGTNIAYLNLDHQLGRMAFFDPDEVDQPLQTITGFELNAGIGR